jgi:uncharacterized damage-inducible protein DinB
MKHCLLGVAVMLLALVSRPAAQGPSLASDMLKDWKAQKETMLRIADAMPEDKFGFKPTPPQRTYGEQILHVAGANIMLMRFLGAKAGGPAINATDLATFGLKASTKADFLRLLGESFDYGEAVLMEFTDETLTGVVKGPPWIGQTTRARMAWFTMGHVQDIYGQMAVYLRLNGVVPPASRRGGV